MQIVFKLTTPDIINQLKELETKEKLKVLFASENSMDAWGLPSNLKEHEICFIYIRPKEWYLAIDDKSETIELALKGELNTGKLYGIELRKFLRMFYNSQLQLMEWLQSPVIYKNDLYIKDRLRKLTNDYFSPRAGINHYLGIARRLLQLELETGKVALSDYFIALKCVFSCNWIVQKKVMPPVEFSLLLQAVQLEHEVFETITDLFMRRRGDDKTLINRSPKLNAFIASEINKFQVVNNIPSAKKRSKEPLDTLFLDLLKKI